MENLIIFESYVREMNENRSEKTPVNEGFWDSIFGKPTVDDAKRSSFKGQGWSHTGKDDREKNYVVFDGRKFYPEEIVYDEVYSTKKVPRVENGKLVVANPAWSL